MTFVERLDSLIKAKKLNRTKFLEMMKFGKNQITYWENNNALPKAATLDAIAAFFDVSVEYLLGLEDKEVQVNRVVERVVEWLIDSDYEYLEEANGSVCVGRDDKYIYLNKNDFTNECLNIKKVAEEDGFRLAVVDWARRNLVVLDNSNNMEVKESTNVISDSPNATISVIDGDISKQEREIIEIFRELSLQNQVKFISHALKLKESEE